ncbi:MAG: protease modulator HflK [Candidatus Schekmanbacteria bacterium]|nr:protease modulator HflK [Candidatus Schekmanbacteria bacterium]
MRRRRGNPSELGRLAAPLLRGADAAWQRMSWWIALLAALYAVSGVTVVAPDEVAVVLRWGRLVGASRAAQEHGPGLLLALPAPIDQVVRVKVKRIRELAITTLASGGDRGGGGGYALTGDFNVVHVTMVARYKVREIGDFIRYAKRVEDALRVEVTAAMVRSIGELAVDHVLSDGRKALIQTATRRAQAGLDAARAGIEIVALELTALAPPTPLARDFDAVQSAYIGAETRKKEAEAFAQEALPKSRAAANAALQAARADARTALARARGDAAAFLALSREYRANPAVVGERLYRDAVERAIGGVQKVRWVPPPAGDRYQGLRISVAPPDAGAPVSPAGANP